MSKKTHNSAADDLLNLLEEAASTPAVADTQVEDLSDELVGAAKSIEDTAEETFAETNDDGTEDGRYMDVDTPETALETHPGKDWHGGDETPPLDKVITPPTVELPTTLEDMLTNAQSGDEDDLSELMNDPGDAELYKSVTLAGLRKYRPDLVKILNQTRQRSASPSAKKTSTPKVGGALSDFQTYLTQAQLMYQADKASVSGRRFANLAKKYLRALDEANISLEEGTEVTFSPNDSGTITPLWFGKKPENIPATLNDPHP